MKKIILFFAFFSCQNLFCLAQQHSYFGFRGIVSIINSQPSEQINIQNALSLGGGFVYLYPFSDNWEMTAEASLSFYKIKGKTAEYVEPIYKMSDKQALKLKSFDFNYCILWGLGSEQKFKIGAGVTLGFIPNTKAYDRSPYFANSLNSVGIYYWNRLFNARLNYGVLLEGVYNLNDALQFSLTYKHGLANLYGDEDDTFSWKQNALGMTVTYYFGGKSRGNTTSGKQVPKKSKYQW